MPRALLLLKVYTAISGQEIHIQGFPVKEDRGFRANLLQYSNEAIKLWGSIIEMTGHYLTGELLLDAPSLKKVQTLFKKNLLL